MWLQVWRSSHVPVGGDTYLAQDFRPLAKRAFSLFWGTGSTALQVTVDPDPAEETSRLIQLRSCVITGAITCRPNSCVRVQPNTQKTCGVLCTAWLYGWLCCQQFAPTDRPMCRSLFLSLEILRSVSIFWHGCSCSTFCQPQSRNVVASGVTTGSKWWPG